VTGYAARFVLSKLWRKSGDVKAMQILEEVAPNNYVAQYQDLRAIMLNAPRTEVMVERGKELLQLRLIPRGHDGTLRIGRVPRWMFIAQHFGR
jgi:hypothetical protein